MNLFINNKYTTWYYNIINNAKARPIINEGYTEKHHIIPKCMGGEKMVVLTAKEHFICHWLLTKMTEGRDRSKMYYAFTMMLYVCDNNQQRYKPASRTFQLIKENLPSRKGKNGSRYGKTNSAEHNRKISEANKGKEPWHKGKTGVYSDKVRQNISNALLGHDVSDETRLKISKSRIGISQTEKTKKKISDTLKSRGNMIGNKNPAKRPEVREKISESLKKYHKKKRDAKQSL